MEFGGCTRVKSLEFTDENDRRILLELVGGGLAHGPAPCRCTIEGQSGKTVLTPITHLYAEDRLLRIKRSGKMGAELRATVPIGKEALLLQAMELFSRRNGAAASSPLFIHILSAQGLRNADPEVDDSIGEVRAAEHMLEEGKSDPYCTCEIIGRPNTRFKTRYIANNLNPVWNHLGLIDAFTPGDELLFRVYDKDWNKDDDFLGQAELKLEPGSLPAFQAELKLSHAGEGIEAVLIVKILAGISSARAKEAGVAPSQSPREDLKFGFSIGDIVKSSRFNPDVSRGEAGTVVGFVEPHFIQVKFRKGTWNFKAVELQRQSAAAGQQLELQVWNTKITR